MQISQIMEKLEGVRGQGSRFTARCPAHQDRHNSLSVTQGENGRILLKCHAGCSTPAVLAAMGLQMKDLFEEPILDSGKKAKVQKMPHSVAKTGHLGGAVKQKNITESPGTLPLPKADSARGETNLQKCKFTEIIYQYHTQDGEKLFQVVRHQYPDGSKTFRQRRQSSEGKMLYTLSGVEPVLYRLPQLAKTLENGGDIYLCEGEKDADAMCNLGLCASTAPMGAGKWRQSYTQQIARAQRVFILPDNDKPGRAHALAIGQSLSQVGISVFVVDLKAILPSLPKKGDVTDVIAEFKDASPALFAKNAMILKDFAQLALLRDEEEENPPYTFENAAIYLQRQFWEDIERASGRAPLSSGFHLLDKQLDGRLYPGLYVVGSVSSLGKTAFCLQMADAIAAQNVDVLFFTLEMSRAEMLARSLCRTMFVQNNFECEYSIGHIFHGSVEENILESAAAHYHQKVAKHISFLQGDFATTAEDVAKKALLHYAATGRRPVVFVDYLQILRPQDVRMSDKQAMDLSVITLKKLSRELDVPVIAISSFNRQNYSEEVNMASFKESGAIEYSADFILGLQARGISDVSQNALDEKKLARLVKAETKSAKQKMPRPIEAITLKNRRGPAWACFEMDFYPKQNYFAEIGFFVKNS